MKRRNILKVAAGAAACGAVAYGASLFVLAPPPPERAEQGPLFDGDRILGNPDASVTIIEYSSLTCSYCARFHADVLPRVKKNWIEAGKARLVYRHFPLDGLALRAAAVANCFDGKRYFGFLDATFASQQRWTRSSDPLADLARIARLAGMSQEAFDRCVEDEAEIDKILERRADGEKTYGVDSTPTLIVNGETVRGNVGYEDFEEVLERAAP